MIDAGSLRTWLSLAVVLGVLAIALWALRRGLFQLPSMGRRSPIVVETATSLGERRSLAIVSVEDRRLLLGLTPSTVSFLCDLGTAAAATKSLTAFPREDGRS